VLGSVTVNYIFNGKQGNFAMVEGEFSKEFDVHVPDSNDNPQKDRVLYLNITSVTGRKYPLLCWVCIVIDLQCSPLRLGDEKWDPAVAFLGEEWGGVGEVPRSS